MTFAAELANKFLKTNVVIKIGAEYYSQYAVDSGLSVDADKIGLIRQVTVNPTSVDIRNVKTTINSVDFQLVDKDDVITDALGASTSLWHEYDVLVYVGFITGSFAWADYQLISTTKIKSIKKQEAIYSFKATEVTDRLNAPIFNTFTTLSATLSDVATTASVVNTADFPSSGIIKIDDEFIAYSGKTATSFTGLTRGNLLSTAVEHTSGVQVFEVTLLSVNPITMLLQILISEGGTGTYDVLDGGVGLDESLVDVTTFESIRTDYFPSETYRLYLYNIENALQFLEENILLSTGTRFITKEGKISLGVLDQLDLSETVEEITEDSSLASGLVWNVDFNKIINKIIIKWNFTEGTQEFSRVNEYTSTDSITTYGEKKPLELEFKGVHADIGGATIVAERGARLLERLSTPMTDIDVVAQFDTVLNNVADKILMTNRFVPSSGGGLGMSSQLEILSKAINLNDATVRFKLQFTSYANLRIGLICPTSNIVSITSQAIFNITAGHGALYKVGDILKLWNNTTAVYEADAANTILTIATDTITMTANWTTTLTVNHRIKFADYDEAAAQQTQRYAFVCPNTGTFVSDGLQAYQIIV